MPEMTPERLAEIEARQHEDRDVGDVCAALRDAWASKKEAEVMAYAIIRDGAPEAAKKMMIQLDDEIERVECERNEAFAVLAEMMDLVQSEIRECSESHVSPVPCPACAKAIAVIARAAPLMEQASGDE